MNDTRETIRFNINNPMDAKIVDYLGRVQDKKKGAFIKEALEMYIEAIEQGVYECPYLGEKKLAVSKFSNIINNKTENTTAKTLDDLSSHSNEDFLKEIDKIFDSYSLEL